MIVGKNPTDEYLDAMMNEAPGPINFTMFLTMFGEKLNGTDPEDVIRNAFACFDEEATGKKLQSITSNFIAFDFDYIILVSYMYNYIPVQGKGMKHHPNAMAKQLPEKQGCVTFNF